MINIIILNVKTTNPPIKKKDKERYKDISKYNYSYHKNKRKHLK